MSAQDAIRAGEAFQIVLSQRAERPTSASALDLYRALRRVNPSPYLFLLELDELALIGSSPETLVKVTGRRASLNPIAGTTEAGEGDAERLLASAKDRAEHIIFVDLGRTTSPRLRGAPARRALPSPALPQSPPRSDLRQRATVSALRLLRACFPAGTVSGAPKGAPCS